MFKNDKNQLKEDIFLISLIFILFCIVMHILGYEFGPGTIYDYSLQHVKFIDYIRNNFFETNDLFPQFMANFGLGQSFAYIYYYGMYNPFIMISFLMPFLSTKIFIQIMYLIFFVSNIIGMRLLLLKNNITLRSSRLISVAAASTGAWIFHMTDHIMFIYYVPIFLFSLIYIHNMVEDKKYYLYPLFVALIFYTNFYFAPVVSIVQFLYFVVVYLEYNGKKGIVRAICKFMMLYIIGVLMGLFILLPQIQVVLNQARGFKEFHVRIGIIDFFSMLITQEFSSGIHVWALICLFGLGFIVRENRKAVVFLLFVFVSIVFRPLNLLLNAFQYENTKILIYILPLVWIVIGFIFDKLNKKLLIIIVLISYMYTIMFLFINNGNDLLIITTVTTVIIVIYLFNDKFGTIMLCLLFSVNLYQYLDIIEINENERYQVGLQLNNTEYNQLAEAASGDYEYRTLVNEGNYRQANNLIDMDIQIPTIYTSLVNSNFQNFIFDYYAWESIDTPRIQSYMMFDNNYLRNYLGIKYYYGENGEVIVNNEVNPIIYGVDSNDVYNMNYLNEMNPIERDVALNTGLFVNNDSTTNNYTSNSDLNLVYENNTTYKPLDGKELTEDNKYIYEGEFLLPESIRNQEGTLIITIDANITESNDLDAQQEFVTINGHTNLATEADQYLPTNSNLTFVIDKNIGTNSLKYEVQSISDFIKEPIEYNNIKIYFQDKQNIEQTNIDVIEPTNFEYVQNKGYNVTINMENDGYIATTIPYDTGFKIILDGQNVEYELVNNAFIGFPISKGSHKVVISYEIPGFKAGAYISSISAALYVSYIIYKNRKV